MNKFITNYASVKKFEIIGLPAGVVTEIDTPYGKGHRFTSGGANWQWIYITINSFLNSGVLRVIARSSVNCDLNISSNNNEIGRLSITTDWSVLESEVLQKPDKISSYYGLDEGGWVEICDAIVLSDRDSLNQLDAINVPLFKADTMPILINQGA